ncbi:hypothetical protein ANN_28292 [Periplaneta americana]|uniref:Uncharacterized protein n=1 Tax=Periplaneta americana TaxID=6978 RepID=A0ABQ8TMI0_PERAM|nr:hypothetical protein ANN_28292 [Periplaneta americana]
MLISKYPMILIKVSRMKSCPFTAVEAGQHMFYKWGSYMESHYKKKSPFGTRPITEIFIGQKIIRTITLRECAYNAAWVSHISVYRKQNIPSSEISYHIHLPVLVTKFNDLQLLSQFCCLLAKAFYKNIKIQADIEDDD